MPLAIWTGPIEFGPGVTELSITAIETNTGGPTVRVVEPLTSPLTGDHDAVITVVPLTKVVARPVSAMDATAGAGRTPGHERTYVARGVVAKRSLSGKLLSASCRHIRVCREHSDGRDVRQMRFSASRQCYQESHRRDDWISRQGTPQAWNSPSLHPRAHTNPMTPNNSQ